MQYTVFDALWIALIVLVTLWLSRMVAGVMANSDNPLINKMGTALGSVVA